MMKDEFKLITLDYDDITKKELLHRVKFIFKDRLDCYKIKIFQSPLSDYKKCKNASYHVYVYLEEKLVWQDIMR